MDSPRLCEEERTIQTVCLSFFRFPTLSGRLWAFAQMGFARPVLASMPEVKFWKLFGSGVGEGFTPIPNTAVYAVMTVFDDRKTAQDVLTHSPLFARYRAWAEDHWSVFLHPTSVRGAWAGETPFTETGADISKGPLVALTRATLRPRNIAKFWGRVPAISKMIGSDPNVIFKIGIGEVPWFHQVTFSIWPNAEKMAEFARLDGPHARAIKAVREHDWFREELYARFTIAGEFGTWPDLHSLAPKVLK
ncbi:MAG: spheroidene monooxygenase [Pseudomonadota bacterium]